MGIIYLVQWWTFMFFWRRRLEFLSTRHRFCTLAQVAAIGSANSLHLNGTKTSIIKAFFLSILWVSAMSILGFVLARRQMRALVLVLNCDVVLRTLAHRGDHGVRLNHARSRVVEVIFFFIVFIRTLCCSQQKKRKNIRNQPSKHRNCVCFTFVFAIENCVPKRVAAKHAMLRQHAHWMDTLQRSSYRTMSMVL